MLTNQVARIIQLNHIIPFSAHVPYSREASSQSRFHSFHCPGVPSSSYYADCCEYCMEMCVSQIREIISNVNKLWKIRSAVWVWQWPCGLGAGPPERERVLGSRPRWVTVLSCFTIFSYKLVWKAVFVFCINLVTFVVSLWVLISV